jgi:hypothetical protein
MIPDDGTKTYDTSNNGCYTMDPANEWIDQTYTTAGRETQIAHIDSFRYIETDHETTPEHPQISRPTRIKRNKARVSMQKRSRRANR